MMYLVNNNVPNQYPNINKCVKALKKLEFHVVYEQFMTPAAKFADIVLPTATSLERMDITAGGAFGFHGFMGKAVDPVGETRSHFDILCDLATRLGISDFTDKTEEEWCKSMALGSEHITDWEAFKKAGVYKIKRDKPYIAFSEQIEDLENNPFNTPSGKIEIYCQRLADMDDSLVPPVPKYIEPWEGPNDPLARKYPLQLITTHFWRRAHSQYDNLPWLREIEPQAVQLNSIDAKARGLKTGDMVKVFNDRGVSMLTLRVTERLMPGVVDIPQGAWYDPDENGVDRAGSSNVLTKDMPSPGGAFVTNTTLVQVEKAS
jgi:anaerobic dimethyl sulfoxide reductase subunit A